MGLGHRRWWVWFCLAAMLWMGVEAQRHGLAHALNALSAAVQHDPALVHTQGCEQCLQFAACDGAVAAASPLPLPWPSRAAQPAVAALPCRSELFGAYESRAPPLAA